MKRSIGSRFVFAFLLAITIMFLSPTMRPSAFNAAAQTPPFIGNMGITEDGGGGWGPYPINTFCGLFHIWFVDQPGYPGIDQFRGLTLADGTYTLNFRLTAGAAPGQRFRLGFEFNGCCHAFDIYVSTDGYLNDNTHTIGNTTITLTDFTILNATEHPENGDLVAACFPSPDGVTDTIGSFTLVVSTVQLNQAPVVNEISAPTSPVQDSVSVSASGSFTDQNVNDSHTAEWNWGDGQTSAGSVTEAGGSGSVTGSHAYAAPGVYTVALTVTDNGGLSGLSIFQYVVVYDPDGGFVTGGGWINSPAGAYAADPSLTGKANFGFNSKYQHGANVPTGNTEFQFKAGNLNFKSTDYDWLVIAGAKAQYKGTGKINGSGNYSFMLTAIDGQINGGGGVDKFRLKIWDKDNGGIVYDNQLGGADNADPTTALGGGSIVIHKP